MKQVIQNFRTGELFIEEAPTPLLQDNGILVKNHYSLVSVGTEKAIIEFAKQNLAKKAKSRPDLVKDVINKIKTDGLISAYKIVKQRLDTHLPLGYSSAGEIIGIGKKADGFNIKDLIACGGGGYASHAEVIYVPKNLCVKIPENITTKEAAFVALGAIAMQGVRVADITPGEKVAVIGLGLIGQLIVQILDAYGYQTIGLDISKNQLRKAQDFGLKYGAVIGKDDIEKFVQSMTNGIGVDAAIISAATKENEPIEIAGKICREKGRISVVGDVNMKIPRNIYYEKELELLISRSYGPGRYDSSYEEKGIDYPIAYARWTEKRNMEEFLRLISIGRVNVIKMISHIFRLEDASKAYKLILENPNKEEFTGVLLEYDLTTEHKSKIMLNHVKKEKSHSDVVNAGLIGAGSFAQTIILPSINKIKELKLKAVADARGETAKYVANKYNCKYATSDYLEILDDEEIELIIIATRHNLHAKIACEALKRNKNVHLEKPLALDYEQLKDVIEAERGSKGRLMVGFNRRFAPLTTEVNKFFASVNTPLMIFYRINAGFIPKEHWVHMPDEGGGRIIGEVCHFVDFIQSITHSSPERVYASKISAVEPTIEKDNVGILIDFADGSRGNILYTSLGTKAVPKEYIEIFADERAVIISNFISAKFFDRNKSKKVKKFIQDKGHHRQFENFVNAILVDNPSPISTNDLFLTSMVTFKILESLDRKEPITVDISEVLE